MRDTRAGSLQDAIRKAYAVNGGIENAAIDMQVSVTTASYGLSLEENRPFGIGANYLDRLARARPESAVPLAQHFSNHAGGVFLPFDNKGETASDIATLTREFSDILMQDAAAHSAASENPTGYTKFEALAQMKEILELQQAAARLYSALTEIAEGGA